MHIIYLENGELRAYTSTDKEAFESVRMSVTENNLLYYNGTKFPENVTPEVADILPAFIKSMERHWKGSATFLAPKALNVPAPVVETPVAAKKPRKKKATKPKGEK